MVKSCKEVKLIDLSDKVVICMPDQEVRDCILSIINSPGLKAYYKPRDFETNAEVTYVSFNGSFKVTKSGGNYSDGEFGFEVIYNNFDGNIAKYNGYTDYASDDFIDLAGTPDTAYDIRSKLEFV